MGGRKESLFDERTCRKARRRKRGRRAIVRARGEVCKGDSEMLGEKGGRSECAYGKRQAAYSGQKGEGSAKGGLAVF